MKASNTIWMLLAKGWQKLRTGSAAGRTGAVQMEYVILALLIAAAGVCAVIVFGRSISTMFFTAGQAATGDVSTAQAELEMRRQDREIDRKDARDYHDVMHD